MIHRFKLRPASLAAAAACTLAAAAPVAVQAQPAKIDTGRYTVGDFHNHATCSDGQISVQRLVNKSVDTYGLDWFVMAGHGGSGNRNCTLVDDAQTGAASGYPFVEGQGPNTTWANSVGKAAIKGDLIGTNPDDANRRMHRWQIIQEYMYPVMERVSALRRMPLFMGQESVVAGHEHGNMAITNGQLPVGGGGNASPVAQWDYCFDRGTADLSRGGANNWDCAVPGSAMNSQLDPVGRRLTNNVGLAGHLKTVEGVKWMGAFFPATSYYIPAHVERAGVFDPASSRGFDIQHFRNFNNAAPNIAFGMEAAPGHQANSNRSYGTSAAGRGTYGGMGHYTTKVGGLWDTLLGEGRNFFIFNNSDWHNRGAFGPDAPQTTQDHYPGEFNKAYTLVQTGGAPMTPKHIVDGMRTGNTYIVNGDLIDKMQYVVCKTNGAVARANPAGTLEARVLAAAKAGTGFFEADCAQQGSKLVVNPGDQLRVVVALRDPEGTNLVPYSIPNPALAQIGMNVPLNMPVLHHVDLIGGLVTGYVAPDSPRYEGAAHGGRNGLEDHPNTLNSSTTVKATWNSANWKALPGGWRVMTYSIKGVQASQYLRLRGTNIPAGVPNETDANGNPLVDLLADNITVVPTDPACADAALAPTVLNCVTHLPVQGAGRRLNNDVEAGTDLWFYSNPVFVEVRGGTPVAGVKAQTMPMAAKAGTTTVAAK